MTHFLQDEGHKFHETATRFQMKISFEAYDFYAADIFYHNSGYIKFAIKKKVIINKYEQIKNLQNEILEEFLHSLKKLVIHQKEAFLLQFPDD